MKKNVQAQNSKSHHMTSEFVLVPVQWINNFNPKHSHYTISWFLWKLINSSEMRTTSLKSSHHRQHVNIPFFAYIITKEEIVFQKNWCDFICIILPKILSVQRYARKQQPSHVLVEIISKEFYSHKKILTGSLMTVTTIS